MVVRGVICFAGFFPLPKYIGVLKDQVQDIVDASRLAVGVTYVGDVIAGDVSGSCLTTYLRYRRAFVVYNAIDSAIAIAVCVVSVGSIRV